MAVETLIPVEEYLHTSYSPDKEYRDGVLVERNVGDKSHARLQTLLALYLGKREEEWEIEVFTELRIRARENLCRIPDVCVYSQPGPEDRVPSRMPLLWIEIISPDDRLFDVWEKAREVVDCGCPYVWIIHPDTLESELRTSDGMVPVPDQTLSLPNSAIVIPLRDVVNRK